VDAYNDLVVAADETAESFEELNDALTNIPDGFKVAYATWQALDAETTNTGDLSTGAASFDTGATDVGSWGSRFDTAAFEGAFTAGIPHFANGGIVGLVGEAGRDAIALPGLLEGLGHTWSFDDSTDYRFSSKGAPTLVVLGTVTYGTSAPSPKYGAGRIGVSGGSVSWALGYTNHWTMMAWKWSGSVWNHYIVRDDGAKWVDGVFTPGASTTFFVVGSGNFALVNGGAATYFDDLVVLPYRVSGDMAVAFGTSTEAFGLLPKLKLSGAIIPEQTSIDGFGMEPAVVSSPAVISGAYDANAASVQFSIREG
jgi:hypothetical protein